MSLVCSTGISFGESSLIAKAKEMMVTDRGATPEMALDPKAGAQSGMGNIVLAENREFAVVDGAKAALPKIIIQDGRTLVPLHFFRLIKDESKVMYNPAEKSVTVAANGKVARLVAGSNEIRINGQLKLIDVPMKIYGERAYVPVRYIAEIFEYEVSFVKNDSAPTMIGICRKGHSMDYNKALELFSK